mgnify:CR=1 FL=1
MKSKLKKSDFTEIYKMLDEVSPVPYDCGTLCGCACCMAEGSDYVMYLLPGEEKMFTGKEDWLEWGKDRAEDYEFPESWHGYVYYIRCKNAPLCHRSKRPIQCRTYPLTPYIDEYGVLELIYNTGDYPYNCPLVDNYEKLDDDFIRATYEAWKKLLTDPYIYDLVELDSCGRDPKTIINP